MDYRINPNYNSLEKPILAIPRRFEVEGEVIEDNRNVIKILDVEGVRVNVKSFKVPNVINQFAYAYIRKGKAQRSYEYANLFREKGIGTPEPVAYIVKRNAWGVTRSYYISLQVDYDYLFRDLREKRPADLEFILREFTRFTHYFHSQSVYFVDHSPGNTLIKRTSNGVEFSLVDLNRVKFMHISPFVGLKNFYRLNATDDMIEIIADEYARLTHSDSKEMIRLLKEWTHAHDERVRKRKEKRNKVRSNAPSSL